MPPILATDAVPRILDVPMLPGETIGDAVRRALIAQFHDDPDTQAAIANMTPAELSATMDTLDDGAHSHSGPP